MYIKQKLGTQGMQSRIEYIHLLNILGEDSSRYAWVRGWYGGEGYWIYCWGYKN